jgi:hypothetical protein
MRNLVRAPSACRIPEFAMPDDTSVRSSRTEPSMAAKTAVAVKKQPRALTEEEILKAPEKD